MNIESLRSITKELETLGWFYDDNKDESPNDIKMFVSAPNGAEIITHYPNKIANFIRYNKDRKRPYPNSLL